MTAAAIGDLEKLAALVSRERESLLGRWRDIVKTFIEAHDGAVSVESTEGVGSTFHFTLPPGPPAAAARAP